MRIAALTGAGISAESGVPTFRGAAGLWRDHRPEELATLSAFQSNPKLVWEFYAWRRKLVSKCDPNQAHLILAEIESTVKDFPLITQNVDGLHQKAGSQNVIELHGSLWNLKCTICNHQWASYDVPMSEFPPKCPRCSELARPDVVWFGEGLDQNILQKVYSALEHVDTLLVIGTSAQVYPAAGLPKLAKESGASIVEINPQETPLTNIADEVYREAATSGLHKWWLNFGGQL